MDNILNIFLTSSLTIIGSVIIYVLGQILSKFIIEPIHEQKKIIGEIADALIYYANIYTSTVFFSYDERAKEASTKIRQLATLLISKTHLVPFYNVFEKIKIITKRMDVKEAHHLLIGLANSIPPRGGEEMHNSIRVDKIRKLLNIDY